MNGYVFFDVDGCLVDFQGQRIPETLNVLRLVRVLDFDVRVWSTAVLMTLVM